LTFLGKGREIAKKWLHFADRDGYFHPKIAQILDKIQPYKKTSLLIIILI